MEVEPILILGMPRSGSSMTAGIFAKHGCWVGNCRPGDKLNAKGYYENLDVKRLLINNFGRLAQTTSRAWEMEGFRKQVFDTIKPKGKWIAKFSALYFPAWHEFDPKIVCVRRDPSSIMASNMKTGFLGSRIESDMMKIIDAHNQAMDCALLKWGGYEVYPNELIEGDYRSIDDALRYCGIEMDYDIVKDHVEPKLWRQWSR